MRAFAAMARARIEVECCKYAGVKAIMLTMHCGKLQHSNSTPFHVCGVFMVTSVSVKAPMSDVCTTSHLMKKFCHVGATALLAFLAMQLAVKSNEQM